MHVKHCKQIAFGRIDKINTVTYLRLKLLCLGDNLFHCQAAFQGLQLCRTVQKHVCWID